MFTIPTTTPPETLLFIEALQAVLQAEDKTFSAFCQIYGDQIPEDGGKTGGEDMFHRSGLSSLFEELRDSLKNWIGQTEELSLQGLLSTLEDKSGEKEERC